MCTTTGSMRRERSRVQSHRVVADNMIRPANTGVEAYARAVRAKPGISSVMLPVDSGLEISRLAPQGE